MKVLVFAPHPDDEIIGIGGTIAKKAAIGDDVYVCIVTSGQPPIYSDEATLIVQDEARRADNHLGVKETIFLNFPAVMLETVPRYKLNESISRSLRLSLDDSPSRAKNVYQTGCCNLNCRRFGYKICQQGYCRQYVLLGCS